MNYNQLSEFLNKKYTKIWEKDAQYCCPEIISRNMNMHGYLEDDRLYALFVFYDNDFESAFQNNDIDWISFDTFENHKKRPIKVSIMIDVLRDLKLTLVKNPFTEFQIKLLDFFLSLK